MELKDISSKLQNCWNGITVRGQIRCCEVNEQKMCCIGLHFRSKNTMGQTARCCKNLLNGKKILKGLLLAPNRPSHNLQNHSDLIGFNWRRKIVSWDLFVYIAHCDAQTLFVVKDSLLSLPCSDGWNTIQWNIKQIRTSFFNVEGTPTCSSIGDRTQTAYFYRKTNKHRT